MERTRLRDSTYTTLGYPEHALPGARNRDGKGSAYVEVVSASDRGVLYAPYVVAVRPYGPQHVSDMADASPRSCGGVDDSSTVQAGIS